jgi:UDP-N-acetylglucosamine acyltransferase
MTRIHPSAVVEDGAALAADVEVGPHCFVEREVKLGEGVRLLAHVVVSGDTEIGPRTIVHAHAALGGPAQFRSESGMTGALRIGAGNVIREGVTMNRGTDKGGRVTTIGDDGFFMAGSHVGHDCHVGNGVTFANGVAIAGHVSVADNVNIGGLAAVLQYVRIGRDAFVGGVSGVPTDVIPYGLVQGSRAFLEGLNLVGLKRKGIPRDRIHALRNAFRELFYGEGYFTDRVNQTAERWGGNQEVDEIIAFIRTKSKRQICVPAGDSYETADD